MADVRYYLKYPQGRQRLEAKDDRDALSAFKRHWSATATYSCAGKRELVKETRTTLAVMPVTVDESEL